MQVKIILEYQQNHLVDIVLNMPDKRISNHPYTISSYLQSLGLRREVVGKTFSEICFGFEPKN